MPFSGSTITRGPIRLSDSGPPAEVFHGAGNAPAEESKVMEGPPALARLNHLSSSFG